ncbi:tocopherol cyclase, chloroplastic-like [Rhodamnia argentea]|uniref:Tocopherol cyclase, chloroplastic-like n=1 Tax=Rhodamnia argentea TaxID=178133 RepID=A0A8B8QA13_9MYRT|nr:tocopherol cyclase, chloroplastic-like [Rhodamnia argentea]
MEAGNETHKVVVEATTKDPGTTLRAPTAEAGLAPACKDSCFGDLKLQIWERRYDGSKGKMILDMTSNTAAVEIGGGLRFNTWKGKTSTPDLRGRALSVPVDVDGFFGLASFLKPPGL